MLLGVGGWWYSISLYFCIRGTSCTTSPCASMGAHTCVVLKIINGYCEVVGVVVELLRNVISWELCSIHQDDCNIWSLPPWSGGLVCWNCRMDVGGMMPLPFVSMLEVEEIAGAFHQCWLDVIRVSTLPNVAVWRRLVRRSEGEGVKQ